MLDRVESPVLALVLLLVLPISSVRSMMLDRVKNPVLALELSQRYKSKAYIVSERIIYAFSYLYLCWSMLVFVGILFLSLGVRWVDYDLARVLAYASLGRTWGWTWLFSAVFLVLAMFFVVPVLAAVSVVGERQRGTLMFVQLSLLRPFSIVWGKVVASIALVLFPAGVSAFTYVLIFLGLSSLEVPLSMTEALWILSSAVLVGLVVLIVVFAVPVVSVLISTFTKSSAAAGVTAIAVNCGMAVLFVVAISLTHSRVEILSASLISCVVLVWVVCAAVGWACRRLRLPARK